MKYIKKVQGERISLTIMREEDAPIYLEWVNNSEITDGIGTSSDVVYLENELTYIRTNNSKYQFGIIINETEELIGNCGINVINHLHQNAEIGIMIGNTNHHNKGYGQEALRLLLDYSFNTLNLNNIMLKVFSFNKSAIQCYLNVGFSEIGRRRNSYYINGTFHDDVYMDILKSEYIKN